jgi:ATP-binding cassette subfamily B protein
LICVFGFIFFILTTLSKNQSINSILPLASVYIAAFLRVLPSINRILSSYQQMVYYLPSVELIKREINYNRSDLNKKTIIKSFNNYISLDNITFRYNKKNIFEKFNFKVQKGKIYGIKGPSGVGKSTLIGILLGLLRPNDGSVIIDDKKIVDFKWSKILSYVSQNIFLFDGTIVENICLGIHKSKIKIERVNEVLRKTNLYDFVYSLDDNINHNLGENGINLSGGQSQRLAIARSLYKNPKILVLDEITSALDSENENKILETIKKLGNETTCIIISHKDKTDKICDKIITLN